MQGMPIITAHLQGREAEKLQNTIDELGQTMVDAFDDLPEQLIHRDCYPGNFLSSGVEVTGIIDWDHLSLGPRILDPAYFVVQIAKRQIHDTGKMVRWFDDLLLLLEGYQDENTLSVKEKEAFPSVMLSVPIFFTSWLIETEQFSSIQLELDTIEWLHQHWAALQKIMV